MTFLLPCLSLPICLRESSVLTPGTVLASVSASPSAGVQAEADRGAAAGGAAPEAAAAGEGLPGVSAAAAGAQASREEAAVPLQRHGQPQ